MRHASVTARLRAALSRDRSGLRRSDAILPDRQRGDRGLEPSDRMARLESRVRFGLPL